MPSISLVAPVYGVEKYIDQFLESIRRQTFLDFEVILVDDGSKDSCPEILDRFVQERSNYHVIHQENRGVSVARNNGVKQAIGKYVYIVDSDDWLEPTALEVLWREAERTSADIIYGDYISESPSKHTLRHCFPSSFVTDDYDTIRTLQFAVNSNGNKIRIARPEFSEIAAFGGAPWRAMIKTSLIKENQIQFDPYVKGLGDDILFSLHVYEYVKRVAYISDVIYHYRNLDLSYSHGYKADYLESVRKIFEQQERFLLNFGKNELDKGSFYLRVLIYLQQGMERYFKNSNNPRLKNELYKEFRRTIKSEPYKSAIREAPLRFLSMRRLKLTAIMLRLGFYRLYWWIT